MKALSLVLVLALSACSNCGTMQSVVWPTTVTCAGPVASELVAQVEAILMKGDGTNIGDEAIAALEKLAREHGAQMVSCIVEQLINSWMKPTGEAAPTVQSNAAARAQDFLNRKGVTVQSSGN
jgi:hypothetical protein